MSTIGITPEELAWGRDEEHPEWQGEALLEFHLAPKRSAVAGEPCTVEVTAVRARGLIAKDAPSTYVRATLDRERQTSPVRLRTHDPEFMHTFAFASTIPLVSTPSAWNFTQVMS